MVFQRNSNYTILVVGRAPSFSLACTTLTVSRADGTSRLAEKILRDPCRVSVVTPAQLMSAGDSSGS